MIPFPLNNLKPILIIADDDVDDRMIAAQAVQEAGLDLLVLEAKNGKEAIELTQLCVRCGQTPLLVLLDMNMPVLDGYEAATLLRNTSETWSIPLVIFTTSNYRKDEEKFKAISLPMVTKPQTFKAYQNILVALLEGASK